MHRNDDIGIELFDLGDYLVEIVFRRGAEMKTADDCVDLLDARNLLGLAHRVDNADMSAGAEYDEAPVLHVKARRVLMDVLVWQDLALQLGGRVVARVATEAVLDLEFDEAIGKHLFDTGALDSPGCEGVAFDHCRSLAENSGHPSRGNFPAIEGAGVAELAVPAARQAMAESVFAAGIEFYISRQPIAEPIQEADEPAVMVEMTMADDKRGDLAWIGSALTMSMLLSSASAL
jgi:hypothetical protein